MIVDQMTYGSANRSRMKGYQLLGQSEGVDTKTAKEFCRWAPSHGSLGSSPEAWGLSFFPVSDRRYAIARSMHGGPEYSGRGGLSVITRAIVVDENQLATFDNDPIALARTAMALGYLILPGAFPHRLSHVELPDHTLPLDAPASDFADQYEPRIPSHAVKWAARETFSLLKEDAKIMICGPCDPLPILYLLYDLVDVADRLDISFACGLQRSSRREYRVQFTDECLDSSLQRQLQQHGIVALDLNRIL